jgi:hypothetical protein
MSETTGAGHALSTPEHFSEGFHTAFRKGLDSRTGNHLHAVLSVLSDRVYGSFVRHACSAIADEGGPFDAGILRAACLSWNPDTAFREGSTHLPHGRMLKTGLRLLSHPEWAEIAGFLDYDRGHGTGPAPEGELGPYERDWASLNLDVMGVRAAVSVVSNQDRDHVIGDIRPIHGPSEPDAVGRRRNVVVGWAPQIHGGPRIPTPTQDGFRTFEEAYEACRAAMPALGARQTLYRLSRMRGGDPAWAAAHETDIERLCRHIATETGPGTVEGHRVRRMLWGPDYALQAYRDVRGSRSQGGTTRNPIDDRPRPFRLERYLREFIRENYADNRLGFLARVVLYGEEPARRQLKAVIGERGLYGTWTPYRGADDLLEAWNAPAGMPAGSNPVPVDADRPFAP